MLATPPPARAPFLLLCLYSIARTLRIWPTLDTLNGAPPVHRTPSQCLGRSSEPPPKPPTPLGLTMQAGDAIILDGSHCEGLGGMGGGHLVYRFEACAAAADGVLWSDPLHAAAGALSPPTVPSPPHQPRTCARATHTPRHATRHELSSRVAHWISALSLGVCARCVRRAGAQPRALARFRGGEAPATRNELTLSA